MNPDQPSDGSMWDQRFAHDHFAYGKEPNVWLKSVVETLSPEPNPAALFPADGEGRNAVWAAREGWQATVFDLSAEGEKKCHRLAAEHGVKVAYEVDDLVLRESMAPLGADGGPRPPCARSTCPACSTPLRPAAIS